MARSRRRTPIVGITTSDSEKDDKRRANRNCRRSLRHALRVGANADLVLLPELRDVSNVWAMDKDGKQWIGGRLPELMRK